MNYRLQPKIFSVLKSDVFEQLTLKLAPKRRRLNSSREISADFPQTENVKSFRRRRLTFLA
jgi:hypothetical protein